MEKLFHHGFALIIGVGGDRLSCTVKDAQGLARILVDSSRCAYLPHNVTVLIERQASAARIRHELQRLAHLVAAHRDGSTVLVYFSGHGWQIKSRDEDRYYLIPHGFNPARRKETGISADEFTKLLEYIQAERFLLLLDCCHAGGFELAKSLGMSQTNEALSPEIQRRFVDKKGRAVIASSQKDELSWTGEPYSAFTHALLESLCGKGNAKKDGFVRVADLAMYTRQQVVHNTHDRQHPILDYNHADNFEVAYYGGGSSEEKTLPFVNFAPVRKPEEGIQIDQRWNTGHLVIGQNEGTINYTKGLSPEDVEKILQQAKEVFYGAYSRQETEKRVEQIEHELHECRDPDQLSSALHQLLAVIPIASAAFTLGSLYAHHQNEASSHFMGSHDLQEGCSLSSVDHAVHHDPGELPGEHVAVAESSQETHAHLSHAISDLEDLHAGTDQDQAADAHDALHPDADLVEMDSHDDFHGHGTDGHYGHE
jgi:hypothetical protein